MAFFMLNIFYYFYLEMIETNSKHLSTNNDDPGGFLVQRSIRGRAAEMGLKISLLV